MIMRKLCLVEYFNVCYFFKLKMRKLRSRIPNGRIFLLKLSRSIIGGWLCHCVISITSWFAKGNYISQYIRNLIFILTYIYVSPGWMNVSLQFKWSQQMIFASGVFKCNVQLLQLYICVEVNWCRDLLCKGLLSLSSGFFQRSQLCCKAFKSMTYVCFLIPDCEKHHIC